MCRHSRITGASESNTAPFIRVMHFVVIIGIIIIIIIIIHDDDSYCGYYDYHCCCCCLPSVETRQPVILQVAAGSSHTVVRCL